LEIEKRRKKGVGGDNPPLFLRAETASQRSRGHPKGNPNGKKIKYPLATFKGIWYNVCGVRERFPCKTQDKKKGQDNEQV
jgi:hypothetical protein